jgi:DNA-binding NtrC family response regulator
LARILILHDEAASGAILSEMLERLQHQTIEIETSSLALNDSALKNVDIVFIDQQRKAHSAIQSLALLQNDKCFAMIPIVVTTASAKSDDVIEAMRLGAFDHLSKPIELQDLKSVIERALASPKQELAAVSQQPPDDFFIGLGPAMRHIEKLMGIAAGCNATVLVQGETGTGKDTVARAIHKHGNHKLETLTVIDCTAVPEDYESFKSLSPGAQGTVVLDEIGDLNAQMQAKLVRALKELQPAATAQPQIIATTQYDLISMVKEKHFREDLYYRLNVLAIPVPPLRERGSDILALAEMFLQQARPDGQKRLSSSASKQLLDYGWPGNVRELQNLMYHLTVAIRSMVIEKADLSMITAKAIDSDNETGLDSMDYYGAMSFVEKKLLIRALEAANGSRAEAARLLGINRQLLYAKLKSHGLMSK